MAQPKRKAVGIFVPKAKFFDQELEQGNQPGFGADELANQVEMNQPLIEVICWPPCSVFSERERAFG